MSSESKATGGAGAMAGAGATTGAAVGGLLTLDTLNSDVKTAQYAVRGELVLRAREHQRALRRGEERPFKKLVFCNIGNPQSVGQTPITFPRQVLALLQHLPLADHPAASQLFPSDVIARAKAIAAATPGGVGAYSASQGLEFVREHVADFIAERDGFPANPDDIFLTAGASPAVQMTLRVLIRDGSDGIMVPIPQYPLYSGTIALYGGSLVRYELSEGTKWALKVEELESVLTTSRDSGVNVRAMVVINPGNPTGNCLSVDQMRAITQFCFKNKVLLLADEVYQENVYDGEFTSFKKVAAELGLVGKPGFQLVSFHSVSKGVLGECGRRGGYMELVGFSPEVTAQLTKLASLSLCPNVVGQIMVDLMVKPPVAGDESYDLYVKERDTIFTSLKRRAKRLVESLNALEGVSCCDAEGAMYVFPRVRLSKKAVAAAQAAGKSPDTFYCLRLLDATGLVAVPGSGFGQEEGTYHFRSTFLPPEDDLDAVVDALGEFHAAFCDEFRD